MLTILGSGGATPTPRPFCQCKTCKKARNNDAYKRNSSSLFINDIKTIIDCGEDIADSLNRRKIKQIDNLFITHWHPDHSFGLRPILEANFNFYTDKPEKAINLYLPKKVYKTLKEKYPSVSFFIDIEKTAKLHLIEDGDKVKIGKVAITVVGYQGEKSDTYAYLIERGGIKTLYSPCDTINFDNYKNFSNLDLLISECGLFSNHPSEISFKDCIKRIKEINPKKTILTHIEEVGVKIFGERYLETMKKKYPYVNFEFAYDGMKIKL